VVCPRPGKSEQQKRRLAQAITDDVMKVLQYGEESVSVAFEEVDANDWADRVYQPDIVRKADTLYKKPGYTDVTVTVSRWNDERRKRCEMQGAVLYGTRDIRFEDRAEPTIVEPTDAIISLPVTCICGSDLWPYRGIQAAPGPVPMGHEYCGTVEEIGRGVTSLKRGQFVIGSFFASDNTCPHCRHGYQTSCQQREPVVGAQAPRMRVPLAEGTLVATRDVPDPDMIASMLALSDVMGTGWFAADAANVKPGATVVVVGDGAVGLLGVLSAKQMGAERIIAMSRHQTRQKLAREFGATDIVTERGDEGVERIKQLTNGVGADSVLECVGTQESMQQAIRSTRPGGSVGYVGVPHGVMLDGADLFFRHVRLLGGPAPVRRYLPELIALVFNGKINPGKVFDLTLPLEQVAEGYRAMDERRAIKTLLRP
jgi:threonine dehydrogenase-like Zn-dependent dehydrogenase/phenylpyruvate tautomerase PptA (4-oxalocrotonate tautomerase family)